MKKHNYFIIPLICFILFAFFFNSCSQGDNGGEQALPASGTDTYPLVKGSVVRNVILFIGDGMGIAHVTAARIRYLGAQGRLYMERMPVLGMSDTYTAEELITDSSAAGTALATGFKTKNGCIGMLPDGRKVKNIVEACQEIGKDTGLVVTCNITQSTPAAFAAHVPNRWDSTTIAEQMVKSRVNVILGAGRNYFIPQTKENSRRKDDLDLIQEATKNGYTYITQKDQLKTASGKYILGLFHDNALTFDSSEPTLAEMTQNAIERLDQNPKGFFLMVEGSQIDSFSHRHNTDRTLARVKAMDETVKVALDFAMKNKKTLVLVLADHEAGGMIIDGGGLDGTDLDVKWASRFHTVVPVPVFAFGPGAEKFAGLYDNTVIPKRMAALLAIKKFPAILE